jgi:hypothetical protein
MSFRRSGRATDGQPYCWTCHRVGHSMAYCMWTTCYNCQNTGHISTYCPMKKQKPAGPPRSLSETKA